MKNLKVNLSAIALLLGISSAFAFKAPVRKTIANPYWEYVSGSVTSESSYTELSGSPSCAGNHNICAIQAPADPNTPTEPSINSGLASRITDKDTADGDVFLKN